MLARGTNVQPESDRYAWGIGGGLAGITLASVSLSFAGMANGGAAVAHSGGIIGTGLGAGTEMAIRGNADETPFKGLGYGALVEPPPDFAASAVFPGSPADDAGLRSGDIITHVDTIKVDGDNPLDEILTQYRPRETVTLRVLRGDELLDLSLDLGTRPVGS